MPGGEGSTGVSVSAGTVSFTFAAGCGVGAVVAGVEDAGAEWLHAEAEAADSRRHTMRGVMHRTLPRTSVLGFAGGGDEERDPNHHMVNEISA